MYNKNIATIIAWVVATTTGAGTTLRAVLLLRRRGRAGTLCGAVTCVLNRESACTAAGSLAILAGALSRGRLSALMHLAIPSAGSSTLGSLGVNWAQLPPARDRRAGTLELPGLAVGGRPTGVLGEPGVPRGEGVVKTGSEDAVCMDDARTGRPRGLPTNDGEPRLPVSHRR